MRRHVLMVGLVLALSGPMPVLAQTADGAIRNVIEDQIEAFRADDFDTAFTFASPAIQGMFGSADRFGQMVRQGYPMVWRPEDVRFGGLSERSGAMFQTVLITDPAGKVHLLEYEMISTADGWEINGVRLLRPGALGA